MSFSAEKANPNHAVKGGAVALQVVIPRVRKKDGATAQFHPQSPDETMAANYQRGETMHMLILNGTGNVKGAGVVELFSDERSGEKERIFSAHKRDTGEWSVKFRHPLSNFQAFFIVWPLFVAIV